MIHIPAFFMKPLREFFKRKTAPGSIGLKGIDAYELLSDSLPFGISLIDPDLTILRSNTRMQEWFPRLDLNRSQKCYEVFNDPPRKSPCPECRKHRDHGGKTTNTFLRYVQTTSGYKTLKLKSVPLTDPTGVHYGFLEIAEDVTDQKSREDLQKHHLKFLELINRMSAQIVNIPDEEWDSELQQILRQLGEFFDVDRCCLFDFDPEKNLLSNTHEWCAPGVSTQIEFMQDLPESALPWWFAQLKQLNPIYYPDVETLPPEASREKQELLRQEIRALLYFPMENETGQCIGCIGFDVVNIPRSWPEDQISMLHVFTTLLTGAVLRRQNRADLLQRERQYRQLVDNSLNGILTLELICDVDGTPLDLHILSVNTAGCRILNKTTEQLIDHIASETAPDFAHPTVLKTFSRIVRTREGQTFQITTNDEIRHLHITAYPLHGLRFALVIADNTEREQAIAANDTLQLQLNQALKMESIGRLAGGVAHDFNNTLQVILGNAEMAINFQNPNPTLKNTFFEIRDAAKRSSVLTRQLLTFARQQNIEPKEVNLNESLLATIKMLKRLIGEQIKLEWKLDEKLWPVFIDPGQVDQVLANLCVNAGDAIEAEGSVWIQTENVTLSPRQTTAVPNATPGDYVRLSVRDTGTGIPPELQTKIFEPFVTTKAEGKGTGLGLATVHGIVLQNKGFITLDSTLGKGSCFNIHLPRYHAPAGAAAQKSPDQQLLKGSEHVLIVEDEPMILQMTEMTLSKLGYKTLTAASPHEALALAENPQTKIDLLLTDVVMPEMDGKELARKLAEIRPDLKTIFMSGYTRETMTKYGLESAKSPFIQKPFSVVAISHKLRSVLDTPAS